MQETNKTAYLLLVQAINKLTEDCETVQDIQTTLEGIQATATGICQMKANRLAQAVQGIPTQTTEGDK